MGGNKNKKLFLVKKSNNFGIWNKKIMEKVNSSEADSEADTFSTDAILADLEPLEDLDDAEFGIPPVENPPTLEEILAGEETLTIEFILILIKGEAFKISNLII